MRAVRLTLVVFACLLLTAPVHHATARPEAFAFAPESALIVINGASGPDITTTSSSWTNVPQMKGRFPIRSAGELAATFCAESETSAGVRMFVRFVVDGQAASPSDVVFAAGSQAATHCFSFVKNGLPQGFHTFYVDWKVDAGGTAYMADRSLTVAYGRPNTPELNLLAVAAPSGASVAATTGWTDIPDLYGQISLAKTSDLTIRLSGEAYATSGKRLFTRALVDGQVVSPSDAVLAIGGFTGTRAFEFAALNVAPGTHQVKVQYLVDSGGDGYIGDRTLVVTGTPVTGLGQMAAGLVVNAPSGPWDTITSGGWQDLPDLSGTIYLPTKSDLAVNFTGVLWTSSARLLLRATLDGQAASPSDVLFYEGDFDGAHAYTFVFRGVSRGTHQVKIQWMRDGAGTGNAGDRTMTAAAFEQQVPVAAIAMESDRGAPDYAYGGYFASKVVDNSSGTRLFRGYVRERLFTFNPGVANYFAENSNGNLWMVDGGLFGPYLKQYNEKYYREQVPNPFTVMKLEALAKADANFDFGLYDLNGDGMVVRDELNIVIVFYQDTTFGEVRNIPDYTTNDGVVISGSEIATVYTPDFDQPVQIGLFAHELSHVFINAGDMYETSWDPTAPGPFSLMDQHSGYPHLDPFHKTYAGNWFDAYIIPVDGYINLAAVENSAVILKLRNPSSHVGEYFLVENRQKTSYDGYLPDHGLAVWHIDENTSASDFYRNAVKMVPASGPTNPIQWHNYLYDGAGKKWGLDLWDDSTPANTRWNDGSGSRIGLWAISASGLTMSVYVDVPGPGILVDVYPESAAAASASPAAYQVRLVNTGTNSDTFNLDTNLPAGWASFSQAQVTLASYEERIINMTVSPQWQAGVTQVDFLVRGRSDSNAAVETFHEAVVVKGSAVLMKENLFLPLIRR